MMLEMRKISLLQLLGKQLPSPLTRGQARIEQEELKIVGEKHAGYAQKNGHSPFTQSVIRFVGVTFPPTRSDRLNPMANTNVRECRNTV